MVAWTDAARTTGTWTDEDRNLEGGYIFLITEDGDYMITEDGDYIILEQAAGTWTDTAKTTSSWTDTALS